MNLKRLVEISPLIGSFLIFIGFFKLNYYYGHWDINIINYLDFSEIILSFLNGINILIFFTLLLVIQSVIGFATVTTIDRHITMLENQTTIVPPTPKNTENITTTSTSNNFRGIIWRIDQIYENHPKITTFISFVITLLFSILFMCFVNMTFLYLTFMGFVQLIPYFLEKIIGIRDKLNILQISFIITLFCFALGFGWYEIKQTEANSKKVEIYTDKETFSTNDIIIFLGKTNNFYFFYDNSQKKSLIYSSGSVHKITQTP